MGGPIGGTSGAENIGDLERGLHGSAGRHLVCHTGGQPLERAGDGMDRSRGYLGLKRGRLQLAGAKQDLDQAEIDDRKGVVEGKSVSVRVELGGRRYLKKK